ncbi:uncharacterized protein PG998_011587 [Apiospora kogelbergensis]|uniref:uncharacterized protein n=1 Tax=Apiospora kogelbergensis TaxID=1337665 RepID=UPI0031318317
MEHNPHPQHMGAGPTTEKMPAETHPGAGHGQYQQHQQYQQQYAAPFDQQHQQQYPQFNGGDPHAAGTSAYGPGSQHYAKDETKNPKKSGVMGKGVCFLLLFLVIALLGLAIGLGVGFGQSRGKVHDLESELAAAKSSASPTVFITVTPAATGGATPTSSSSSPTGAADRYSCLSQGTKANNTQYTSSASSAEQTKFNVYCGMDFGDGDGAKNLDVVNTTSVPDCLDACARTRDCQGAGWGSLPGDEGGFHHCYMKTNLSKSHGADKGWTFAVLDSVPVTISQPSQ